MPLPASSCHAARAIGPLSNIAEHCAGRGDLEIDANANGVPRLKDDIDSEDAENYSFQTNLPHIVTKYNCDDTDDELKQLKSFNKDF